ncbi:MAG TPA: SIS domain-containing protein [Acidimicrobiales bacterium]|jgi:D-sedoheptulose 7-phosphate isomerase|nr:SIS domain-containing protein [Acidimicrobiales bacterium]
MTNGTGGTGGTGSATGSEPTGFLYPFIEAEERNLDALMTDLVASARAKVEDSASLRTATLARCADQLEDAASAMADRFRRGGRLFTFGNGGSATDAQGTAELFGLPPYGQALPALSLVDDQAVLTALSNDVGFELVFSRQIIALAKANDIAVGFSTSGDSPNILRAFDEAARRGLLTVGLCGYEGSGMAVSDAVGHCLVVRSDSVHRIQETQDALMFAVWEAVQRHLNETAVVRPA